MADVVTIALQTTIAQWSAALQADSVSPQPSYSLDGKSVSRNEWRTALLKQIADGQDVINQRNPTVTWSGPFGGNGCWGYGG